VSHRRADVREDPLAYGLAGALEVGELLGAVLAPDEPFDCLKLAISTAVGSKPR
jgi:hypothetical protein